VRYKRTRIQKSYKFWTISVLFEGNEKNNPGDEPLTCR
jgi:hypothetical protein